MSNEMQYRCIWEEHMASIDGPFWMPCRGRVHAEIGPCVVEQTNRLQDPKFRRIYIEARPRSDNEWPRTLDNAAELYELLNRFMGYYESDFFHLGAEDGRTLAEWVSRAAAALSKERGAA